MGIPLEFDTRPQNEPAPVHPFYSGGLRDRPDSRPAIRWTPSDEVENRQCRRRSLRCGLRMVRLQGGEGAALAIPGQCLNIGHDGLYAIVPIGYQVSLGQIYAFELAIGECGPEPGSHHTIAQQGRIVRIDLLLNNAGNQLGIGVRLIGPRSGVVPMPS